MRFHVPGTPEPLRRHRAGSRGGRVVTFDDPRNQPYADRVRWAWRNDTGGESVGDVPVVLTVDCRFPRPTSHFRKDGGLSAAGERAVIPSRADVDNLAKAVMDALNGWAWGDDRQVVQLLVGKSWAGGPGMTLPGVHVTIEEAA